MDSDLNPKVVDMISQAQKATLLDPSVIAASGNGKAYQSVAQSAAIAIQDATDALRNLTTVATTAAGVATAQALAGSPNEPAMTQIGGMMEKAIADYKSLGEAVIAVLKDFPTH